MTIDDIPGGTMVFIDANCLVYAATSDPQYGPACQRLLERIENKLIQGCTSASVLGDLAHRLMTIEAALMFGRSMTGIAYWLRRHPTEVHARSVPAVYRGSLGHSPPHPSCTGHAGPPSCGFQPIARSADQRRSYRGDHARSRPDPSGQQRR